MNSINRGALIVIEGMDRSGKSTQCKKLVQLLCAKNVKSEFLNFPDRTTSTGKIISDYLSNKHFKMNDHVIHLLFSANRWESVEKIKSLLYSGTTLIVDRYSYSGIAFSSSKDDMSMEWCKQPEVGLPKPDLVFLLSLSPEDAAKRGGFGEERYETELMQRKVAQKFLQLAQEDGDWRIVDASQSIDTVSETLLSETLKKIESVRSTELATLSFK